MVILNVTAIVEESVKDAFLNYMQSVHIPAVMASGKFEKHLLFQLTEPVNEGFTFCAQYIADSKENLNTFRLADEKNLQTQLQAKFGNQVLCFSSILEKI